MKKIFYSVSILLICTLFVLPTNYIIEVPGPTFNVLGELDNHPITTITIDGENVPPADLDLELTTVNIQGGPSRYINTFNMFMSFLDKTKIVYPTEAVYPINQSEQQTAEENKRDMDESQNNAIYAALKYLDYSITMDKDGHLEFPKGVDVTLSTANIGGPSAGLMFGLGIYKSIAPRGKMIPVPASTRNLYQYQRSYLNQKPVDFKISGTGTIGTNLLVGNIGGINQKITAAINNGSKYFIMPAGNCNDLNKGLDFSQITLVPVKTFDEAALALDAIVDQNTYYTLPTCKLS
jgi:PDZ domain-containing protein